MLIFFKSIFHCYDFCFISPLIRSLLSPALFCFVSCPLFFIYHYPPFPASWDSLWKRETLFSGTWPKSRKGSFCLFWSLSSLSFSCRCQPCSLSLLRAIDLSPFHLLPLLFFFHVILSSFHLHIPGFSHHINLSAQNSLSREGANNIDKLDHGKKMKERDEKKMRVCWSSVVHQLAFILLSQR